MIPVDDIAAVTGVVAAGVHLKAMSAAVPAVRNEFQHTATFLWRSVTPHRQLVPGVETEWINISKDMISIVSMGTTVSSEC